jgi:UDP-N-acetylmuramate--alanine ligase
MIPVTVIGNMKSIHFIGIGGIGMSGLAEYYLRKGYKVSGSDIVQSNITVRLSKMGAEIFTVHAKENVNSTADIVVYSSAVPEDNPELVKAKELHIKTIKRAEMLGDIVNDRFLIAVSGTHGKTTTTAMIAKVLVDAGADPLVFVGGNVSLFEGGASRIGAGKYAVVEADEYDRSFLTLKPDIAVITSIDEDHLDIYKDLDDIKKTFKEFCKNSKKNAKLVFFGDDENIKSTVSDLKYEKISYGFNKQNYLRISDCKSSSGLLNFSINNSHKEYKNISINLIGMHNVLNSAACFAVAKEMGIDFLKFRESIGKFTPVDRRLQLVFNDNEIRIYDDYAHHPKEIEVSLKGLREITPKNGKLVTVFQPHLYSRTRDFYREFAKSLEISDEIILMDIYPAREKPIENVTCELIFNELIKSGANVKYYSSGTEIIEYLLKTIKQKHIVVFQGAGDITSVCKELTSKLKNSS